LAEVEYLLPDLTPLEERCYPKGIVHNFTAKDLEKLGFVPCYIAPYADHTDFTQMMKECPVYIADADFNMPLFFGACESSECDEIYVGAFTNDNRLLVSLGNPMTMGDVSTVTNDETIWYYVRRLSHHLRVGVDISVSWLGFTADESVDFGKEHCDQHNPKDNDRLCWMMDHASGGYRAGNNLNLDNSKKWHKVLYYSNHSMDYYTVCKYDTQPATLNDLGARIPLSTKSQTATSFPMLFKLALAGVLVSLFILLFWKFKNNKLSARKVMQWLVSHNHPVVNQLVSEEYKPLLVTTQES